MLGPGLLSTSDYRRQARRLRGTFADKPARLHSKLRELARRQDAAAEGSQSHAMPTRARGFANEVAARLEGSVLRYSQRRFLMSEARRRGIGPFEANLVIAAVQHERRSAPDAAAVRQRVEPRVRLPDLSPLLVVIAVESLVGLGIWQVCFG
jgi:hypothetical protein